MSQFERNQGYVRPRQDDSPASGQVLLFYFRNAATGTFDVDQRGRLSAGLNGSAISDRPSA